MSINQCDGCQRGLPVDDCNNHIGPGGFWSGDYMACTAHRYEDKREPVNTALLSEVYHENRVDNGPVQVYATMRVLAVARERYGNERTHRYSARIIRICNNLEVTRDPRE